MAKPDKKKLGTHTEMLQVKLLEGELLERAKKVGDVHEELQQHVADADAAKRKLKDKEADLTQEVDRLLHILRTGHEPREVKVEAWANFATERMQEIRMDTMKVINERPLEEHERQGEFDLLGWQDALHKRVERERVDFAKKRAGDKDDEKGGDAA